MNRNASFVQLGFIALAVIAVYTFVRSVMDGEARAACAPLCALRPQYANQDRTAPDFTLPDLEGRPVSFSSFRGKTVVLNFWTKTCAPCLREMPTLVDLSTLLAREGEATLVTITTDESAADARATLASVLNGQPNFPVLIDPGGEVVNGKFGTKLYPETWIIDKNGVIRARVDGARDWSSPIVLDVVRMVSRPQAMGCNIAFDLGQPRGARRDICDDTGSVGTIE